jgi:hypothetical protein
MMTTDQTEWKTCPRCGARFPCGRKGTLPCACASVGLSQEALDGLRERYTDCLCIACLRAFAEPTVRR